MTLATSITEPVRKAPLFALRTATLCILLLAACLLAVGSSAAAVTFEVIVAGVEGDMKDNVEAALATPHDLVRNGKVEPVWARRFARLARDKAARALEPFGYYSAEVATELMPLDDGSYRLIVSVSPGEAVRVSQSSIVLSGPGSDQSRLKRQVASFPLSPGEPLRHDLYEEGKGQLLVAAAELGYLDARFTRHEIRLSQSTRTAEIDLSLETGPQYVFGDVSFHGADDFPETVLYRYLAFAPGDIFVESKLSQTQASLFDADKFKVARVVADRSQAEGLAIPVRIELEPRPQYQIRPGLGYGTDTGPRASLRYRDINTLHLGHEIQGDLLYAERRQALTGRYLVPLTHRLDSLMAFSVEYERGVNDAYDSSSLSSEASLTHGLPKGFKGTVFIKLIRETYEIGDEESRTSSLVMPGVRLGQRSWQFYSPGRPRDGYFWQVEVRGSSASLGSDVSLLQGLIGGSAIVRLPWEMQLIVRAEGGTTVQDEFDDLPASMRFFAGGDQSVRGYAYKSLGPENSDGDVTGGRHLVVGSIEIEKPINPDWSLAAFFDSGNAFDDFNHFKLANGAGLGLRRHTPIGPLKLDLARQVGNGDKDYRIHLGVGFGW